MKKYMHITTDERRCKCDFESKPDAIYRCIPIFFPYAMLIVGIPDGWNVSSMFTGKSLHVLGFPSHGSTPKYLHPKHQANSIILLVLKMIPCLIYRKKMVSCCQRNWIIFIPCLD